MTTSYELPEASPEAVGMSAEGLKKIDDAIQAYIDKGEIQGAVTSVARRGKVVHFSAQGLMDAENEHPMEPDAIFRMASSSKPVAGVAAMIAVEDGLISVTDPVAKYLPEFADMQVAVLAEHKDKDVSPEWVSKDPPPHRLVPAARQITIHDLLTHTSGLASGGLGNAIAGLPKTKGPEDTLADLVPEYAEMALDFQPGTRFAYSAYIGLDVVARILEVVSGETYEEYLRTRIFEPLGMNDTYFFVPPEKEARTVVIKGLDEKSKGWDKPSRYTSASGGLSSTAADYLRFEQMLYHRGEVFGTRILSEESIATMTSNKVGDLYSGKGDQKGVGFGYTVMIVLDENAAFGHRGVGAFGWGGAFGTVSWTDPAQEITAVLMVQQASKGLGEAFEKAIQQAILE